MIEQQLRCYCVDVLISVDPGSLAELYGLVTGDQILLVNGHSFRNILHEEAVAVLRNSPVLIMTVKVANALVLVDINCINSCVLYPGIFTVRSLLEKFPRFLRMLRAS